MNEDKFHCLVSNSFKILPTNAGPLNGKKFAVKDLVAIRGHISSFGHPRWRNTHQKSNFTAPVVEKLLKVGASMVGLTKLDQLAYSLIGNIGEDNPPLNSLYPDRFTGGSSSGSASAVSGNFADIGIGTDTAGSIRIPAASCGLFGFRPTHGRIDSTGVIPLAPSFDVVGLLTKDPSLLLKVFSVLDKDSNTSSIPIKQVLIPKDCFLFISKEVVDSMTKVAEIISKHTNTQIQEINFAYFTDKSVADLFARIQGREIWTIHGGWVSKNQQYLAKDVQTRLDRAKALSQSSDKEKRKDMEVWEEYKTRLHNILTIGTVIVLPIIPDLPPKRTATEEELLQFRLSAFPMMAPSSLSGCPEIVIPVKNKESGMTYGIGLLGAKNEDRTLLNVVATIFKDKN